jgi:hypothetical protein
MTDAATMFAHTLARLDGPDWDRTVIYHYPAQMERPLGGRPSTPCTKCAITSSTSVAN